VNEAYGMTLLEAQATGLPVVAGDFGGVSAIVAHESTGLLASPGDAAAFAKAMAALMRDPARREAMRAAALRKVAAEHDLPIAAAILDRTLKAAVTGSTP
jgi:glycosyltransferase involved in cell wall biosynthesis